MSGSATNSHSATKITEIQFEHLKEAFGISVARPRISWMVETTKNNWRQAGYEVRAFKPNGQIFGQTGRVESDQSVLVQWPFESLVSRTRLDLQVRVWEVEGELSEWSEPAPLEIGLRGGMIG